jgi:hypothetical protein
MYLFHTGFCFNIGTSCFWIKSYTAWYIPGLIMTHVTCQKYVRHFKPQLLICTFTVSFVSFLTFCSCYYAHTLVMVRPISLPFLTKRFLLRQIPERSMELNHHHHHHHPFTFWSWWSVMVSDQRFSSLTNDLFRGGTELYKWKTINI